MSAPVQTTLNTSVVFNGVGLHLGQSVRMAVHPAVAGHGVIFRRTDLSRQPSVPAIWERVAQAPLNTRLMGEGDFSVSTIEHLMAALYGCGIHNVLVDLNGPEVPILDGSSAEFVEGFLNAGVKTLGAPLKAIEIIAPVRVQSGEAWAQLVPSDSLKIAFEIDFSDAAIGHQSRSLNMANGAFGRELCDCRTFCRASDVDQMKENGLALGGTYDNAVVVDGDKVLSPSGLRRDDEAVRHKMLDAFGDLYTAGAPILGAYHGHRAGHALTNALLRELFARPHAWRWKTCDAKTAAKLPGVGLTLADLPAVA